MGDKPDPSIRFDFCVSRNLGSGDSFRFNRGVLGTRCSPQPEASAPERGLKELDAIEDRDRLSEYPFYSAALGELELRRGRREIARNHFRSALALARNSMERCFLEKRVFECEQGDSEKML